MKMNEAILLREWQTVGPADDSRLASLPSLSPEEAAHVAALGRSGRIEILEVRGGLRISTRSYVGSVRLGQTTVHIRPKLVELSPTAMATFLRYALGMDMVSNWDNAADVSLEEGGFTDLIALVLLEEVNNLLRAGVLRDYETHASWRTSPRGRLDLMELARHPMRAQSTLAIPCRVSERVTDIVLNRLVVATLEAVLALVTERQLAYDLHSRAAVLAELCQKVPLTLALLDEADAALDRRSWHYKPVRDIAQLILQGLGTTVDISDQKTSLSSFLLDMNLLFERFLSRLLCDYGPPGVRVETQVSSESAYRWRENPYSWQRPHLRPDIVLYDMATNLPRLILDAKYKPLGATRRPSPADLYQLTLYSLSFSQQGSVPARIVFPEVTILPHSSFPCLDFQGTSCNKTLASMSFYGLPILTVTAAIKAQDETHLRKIMSDLIA
jgi:5-methylcytosine-specific restriction enzyme subunit McrC